jgi:hypothetical protein
MTYASILTLKSQRYWDKSSTLKTLTAGGQYSDLYSTNNPEAASSFLNGLNNKNINSGLLPPGLRVSMPGCVIFERPPSMQLVQYIDATVESIASYEENGSFYENDDHEEGEYFEELNSYAFRIPIPWQLYIATYSTNPASMYRVTSIRMYFMNGPLNHPDVELYAPYINNFFTDASLCTPMFDTSDEIERYPQNIAGVMASAYDWVWNTGFNADLKECLDINFANHVAEKNHIIKDFVNKYENGKLPRHLTRYAAFYDYLSDFTIDDIINLEWANPSYAHHFELDREFTYLNSKELLNQFHNSDMYDPDSTNEYHHYKQWLPDLRQIKKTYSHLIDTMFFWKPTISMSRTNYSDLIKNNNISLTSPEYFCESLVNHIHSNPSLLVD